MSGVQFEKDVGLPTCWVGGRETWMIKEPGGVH